jgi:putative protease
MKITTYAQTLHDLNIIKDQGIDEVILGHKDFSRFGKLSSEEFLTFSNRARELGLKVIFEWDVLMTETIFSQLTKNIIPFLNSLDVFRVQDPGAFEWVLKKTSKKIQFIAENGNHNFAALSGWIDYAAGRLERIVLSIELPKNVIQEYVRTLTIPCELLGLGRILLFYTPRHLLTPLAESTISYNQELTAVGESEESPHKGFPILENRHGTFMFHIKDFCLLDDISDIRSFGLSFMRLDFRWSDISLLNQVQDIFNHPDEKGLDSFKKNYKQDLMRGFYNVNKTDVLFPKLKNHRLQMREGNYLGEIIETEKGSHLAIHLKNPRGLKKSDKLRIVHPKGEEFQVGIFSLKNICLEDVESIEANHVALIQFVGGVWVKSQVFYLS